MHAVLPARSGLLVGVGPWAGIVGGLLWMAVVLTPGRDLFAGPVTAGFVACALLLIVAAAAVQQTSAGEVRVLGWPGLVVFDAALLFVVASLAWYGRDGWWIAAYPVYLLVPLGALLLAAAAFWSGGPARPGAILVAAGAMGLPLNIVWNEDRLGAMVLSAVFGLGWAVLGLGLRRVDRGTS